MDGFLDDEQPVERAARHALEGRIQFATVEALERLTAAVQTIAAKQDAHAAQLAATDTKVATIDGWLRGGVTEEGRPTPGILQEVATLGGAKKWILGLLGTATTAVVVQTIAALLHGSGH